MSDLVKARRLLIRTGAWIDGVGQGYALRIGATRRSRVLLTFNEATFRELVAQPGLRIRPGGGWLPRPAPATDTSSPPGRPGMIDGVALVTERDGRLTPRRANLGQSAISWLARHKDEAGRPALAVTGPGRGGAEA